MTESTEPMLLPGEGSLLKQVVRGGMWMGMGGVIANALPMLRNLILMRREFLSTDEFGLWGVVWVVVAGVWVFTDASVVVALIQRREGVTEEYLQTAWVIQATRGLVLAAGVFAAAPILAGFFDRPELTSAFRWISVLFLVTGLENPRVPLLSRHLDFKRLVLLQQAADVVSFVTAVVCGILWRSFWALVVGVLMREVFVTAIGYVVVPFRPRFQYVGKVARELWGFGRHVYLSNVFLFLLMQGDCVVVGKMLGMGPLGGYRNVGGLAYVPRLVTQTLLSKVSFATYSRMQESAERLASAYLRVLGFSGCLAWPAAVGLILLAPVLPVYAGPGWQGAVIPMQILCVAGLFQVLNGTAGSLFMGIGRPRLLTWLALLNLGLMVVGIYPATIYGGITGTALVVTACQVPIFILVVVLLTRCLPLNWKKVMGVVLAPVPATAGMALGLWLLWHGLGAEHWLAYVLVGIAGGAAVYAGLLWVTAAGQVAQLRHAYREGIRG